MDRLPDLTPRILSQTSILSLASNHSTGVCPLLSSNSILIEVLSCTASVPPTPTYFLLAALENLGGRRQNQLKDSLRYTGFNGCSSSLLRHETLPYLFRLPTPKTAQIPQSIGNLSALPHPRPHLFDISLTSFAKLISTVCGLR
jgi:hypothetical protein